MELGTFSPNIEDEKCTEGTEASWGLLAVGVGSIGGGGLADVAI